MTALVMGVLNVTPDSFFDGGRFFDPAAAIADGREMVAEGAAIVDVGGESTRPGAEPVDEAEELRRVIPIVSALATEVRVSIDTMKPAVAQAAIDAGATLVNDVAGHLGEVAAANRVGLVAMHMQGSPADMQLAPTYDDVVAEVSTALRDAAECARAAGVAEVYVDPGIGFGKTAAHNLALLQALPELASIAPLVVGTSRKSFLGRVLAGKGEPPLPAEERFEGSLATAAWAFAAGAAIVRVHDVAATVMVARLATESIEEMAAGARIPVAAR